MMILTKENKIKRIRWEMKILENLMEKDGVTEFDDVYYGRRYRFYKDQLFKLGVATEETTHS